MSTCVTRMTQFILKRDRAVFTFHILHIVGSFGRARAAAGSGGRGERPKEDYGRSDDSPSPPPSSPLPPSAADGIRSMKLRQPCVRAPCEEGAAAAAPVAQISLSVGLRGGGIGGGGAQEGAEVKTSTTNAAAVANGQAGPLSRCHSPTPLLSTDRQSDGGRQVLLIMVVVVVVGLIGPPTTNITTMRARPVARLPSAPSGGPDRPTTVSPSSLSIRPPPDQVASLTCAVPLQPLWRD